MHFFCGKHASKDHSWETPSGILNSLLAQLLEQCSGLDLTKTLDLGNFRDDSVRTVCKHFECAVAEVPAGTTVLCIIDNLSLYLCNSDMEIEVDRLIYRLLWLVRNKAKKGACEVNVLITAANQLSSDQVEKMDENEVLNVPNMLQRNTGYADTKWHHLLGKLPRMLA